MYHRYDIDYDIYIYMLTPPDTYFLLLIPSFLRNYICAGSKSFARTMWVTCLRERGFKRMKLWRLCTKCCVTSSHLGKLQQVLCTNHVVHVAWGRVGSKGWSYEGFAQSAALQVLTWANYSKYFARTMKISKLYCNLQYKSRKGRYQGGYHIYIYIYCITSCI